MSLAPVRPSSTPAFSVHGDDLFLDRENRVVARLSRQNGDDRPGYVFIGGPFNIGESLSIRIHAVSESSNSVLGFGMTSCDPKSLNVQQLPDDCDFLIDRDEYWVIDKTQLVDSSPGDELTFRLVHGKNGDAEMKFTKNGQIPVSLMFLDKTVPLWAFFELGNVREMGIIDSHPSFQVPVNLNDVTDGLNLTGNSRCSQSQSTALISSSRERRKTSLQTDQVLPTPGRKLPPPPIPPRVSQKSTAIVPSSHLTPTPVVAVTKSIKINQLSSELIQRFASMNLASDSKADKWNGMVRKQTKYEAPPPPAVNRNKSRDQRKSSTDSECLVCMEKDVDSVLYTCGHMCLCFECATDLKNRTNSLCPVCRKVITDVIKTFRS